MAPPVLLYQLDEPYAKKYKWDKLDWKIISADDIDDFDKVSEFFGHNLKAFYQLYIGDTYAERCDSFLDACKAQGFTAFLSIVVYCTYGLRRQTHGTHYVVACKENDKNKLSYYLEQITKKKPVVDNIEPSGCYIMENYRATKYISLRRFFNDIGYDSNDRLEILLSGYAPRPSNLSEKVIKRNLSVARNAKRLERFIASRLNEKMAGTDQPYYFETIEETYNLLKSKLQYLTNATPPLEIKEAQQALNIQLRLFNEAFRYYLQSSDYTDQMLTKLDGIITTVTYVVKALDYGMSDGNWCIVSGCHITNNATNKSTLFIPGYQEHNFADMFPIGSYIAYETKYVQQTNQNNDYFIKFGENKTFPVSFVHVTTPPAQPIAPDELEIDTFYFTAPCSCRPTKKYHWICSSCQAIVREKPNGQVLCSCGVLKTESFKRECPACFVLISTVIELKRSEDAASVSATLKGYSEAKVTSETYRAPKDVIPNHISKTEKQVFNVLILAVSQGALIALYENIKLIYKSQTHYHASGYVVTFDSCSIRFITEIVYQIPEAQKALTAIVKKYFAIHDFIVLTEGKEGTYNLMDVLNTTVPTRARKQNIHFFNVLAFRPNEASNEPPNKVIDIFKIFDYASWKTLRQQADSDNYDKHVLSMEAGIHQFTETIKTARPVTFDDMQMVAYLKRLSAELRTHELTPSIQRLWATIDAHMVDSDARNYMMDARPLNNDELQAQADYWRIRNMEIANLLYKISVFARIGNNLESSSNTNDGAGNTICGNNVTTTKPTSYDLPLRVFHPDVTRLTVLIIGRSKANNAIIIDSIVRNRESEASPITNTENEWIVNYDEYEIKYVNILLNNAPIDWSIYPVIHGFIFVIENKVPHFSFIVEKNLRNLLGMIPRSSAKNCCIVNCFVATSLFSIADASEQLSKFVATFCENHQLTTDVIKHLCVDKSNNTSSAIDTSIEEFVLRNAESPVTMNALKVADCLRELAELLDQKSVESNIERLMASITDRTMSDAALYFREHSTMALPLTNDEWKIAIEWDIDEDLLEVLREINDCFKLDEATGLGKVKSTSMFAMKTGTSSTLPQRSKVAYTKASSVPPVAPTETVKTTQYNVVLLGSSVPNKEMLLNTINCVQQHENCNAAANNADVIKFRDSDDYLIDYGTHSIRYINKDELNIEQSDFHGLMIVIENGTLELSTKANNQIRNVFGRLPRRAMKNCCIVNTFTPSETFALNDAEQQMREFTTKFCEQHALTESPSFICVDTVTTQAVLDHNVTDNANLCQKTSNCKMAWPTRCVSSAFDVGCHSRKRI